MNYRYYRLLNRRATRDADSTNDGQRRLKALQRCLESQEKFDGKDPIFVFAFLTRFTEEADLKGLTEAQALVAIPRFLKGDASLSFQTAQSSGHSGGVGPWSEAVHYLLTTYATPGAMREAVIRVQELKQKLNEDELSYNARLSHAVYRCGNVFGEAQKITFFVNGLLPDIRSRVARHRESIPRHAVRYNMIVQYARDEGESVRAQAATARPVKRQALPYQSQANLLDHANDSSRVSDTPQQDWFLLNQGAHTPTGTQPVSDNTSDLPSTCDLSINPPVEGLYMAQAPRVPHSDRRMERNRPGWKAKPPLICYKCFVKDEHISPDCKVDPLDFATVVTNFEALSPEEQALVPNGTGAYQFAKRCLGSQINNSANQAGPKNGLGGSVPQ